MTALHTPGTQRTDIHRPSNIDPADYLYLDSMDLDAPMGPGDRGPGGLYETLDRHEQSDTAPYQGIPGKCDHCGANLRYVCFWEHRPTGDVITTGEQCATETMDVPTRLLLDQKRIRQTAAARRAAVRERKEVVERQERAKDLYPEAYELLYDYQGTNPFIQDVAGRFGKNGYLSEKQAAAVVRSAQKDLDRQRQREQRASEPKTSCPEGKVQITGEVIKTDRKENDYGVRYVMIVKDDRGFRVWGSIPSALQCIELNGVGGQRMVDVGDRVQFSATVSAADPKEGEISDFGFYKRPTKAELVEG